MRHGVDFLVERLAAIEGKPSKLPSAQMLTWKTVLAELQDDLKNAKAHGLTDAQYSRLSRKAKKLQTIMLDYCRDHDLDLREYVSGGTKTE